MEDDAVSRVDEGKVGDERGLAMLTQDIGITSFAFSWLISRLAGTLPRLVDEVDVEEEISKCSFPLLFFSA